MINLKKLTKSFSYALEGIYLAVKLDQNVRIHLIASIFVFVLSAWLRISTIEFLFIIMAVFFVIITEMVNTAIEEMTNLIYKEHHKSAKVAKDVAAGSVMLSAVFALIVAAIVLVPKLITLV